jgi:pimeloyl-ACP methyl ester carboxylesterase
MASDVLAVMDALSLEKVALIGWSDGACIALVLAAKAPARIAGVFFFACNMDPSGAKQIEPSPLLDRCFSRHANTRNILLKAFRTRRWSFSPA